MGSHYCCASTGTGVALVGIDAMAVLHTAAGRKEGDEADRRGPGFSGREGGEGGVGEAGPSWSTTCWACSRGRKGARKRRARLLLWAEGRERGK